MNFSEKIIRWYRLNRRGLPWRETGDPYRIWVSEVILQQTRVAQGLEYYRSFILKFPDIESLASAGEDEVMKAWQGLGYYSRARHMHAAAKTIMDKFGGRFPGRYDQIRQLSGIGDYTAAAIASIAFGEPCPVVDGNVKRVMARYAGIYEPVSKAAGGKKVLAMMTDLMDRQKPGDFNEAVMELGALVCKPRRPLCTQCPLGDACHAFLTGSVDRLPVIFKNPPLKTRHFHYLSIVAEDEKGQYTWLRKRPGRDIWRNLYDFPLLEAGRELSLEELRHSEGWKAILNGNYAGIVHRAVHNLTHQRLNIVFIRVRSPGFHSEDYQKVYWEDLHNYPVPRPIENYLKIVAT